VYSVYVVSSYVSYHRMCVCVLCMCRITVCVGLASTIYIHHILYMTVCLVISLPIIPYIHRIHMILTNPTYVRMCARCQACLRKLVAWRRVASTHKQRAATPGGWPPCRPTSRTFRTAFRSCRAAKDKCVCCFFLFVCYLWTDRTAFRSCRAAKVKCVCVLCGFLFVF